MTTKTTPPAFHPDELLPVFEDLGIGELIHRLLPQRVPSSEIFDQTQLLQLRG